MAQSKSNKNSKSNSRKRKPAKKQNTFFDIVSKKEFKATFALLAGILFSIVAFFSGGEGSVWYNIHTFWITVFGMSGFYIPVVSVVLSIIYFAKKSLKKIFSYSVELEIGIVLISSIIHIAAMAEKNVPFKDSLSSVFAYGMNHTGIECYFSGELGALFGGGLFALCANKGLCILICVILLVILFMVSFKISVSQVVDKAKVPAGKIRDVTDETAKSIGKQMRENSENRRQERENRKSQAEQERERKRFEEEEASRYEKQHMSDDDRIGDFDVTSVSKPDEDYYNDGHFTQRQRLILGMLNGDNKVPAGDSNNTSAPAVINTTEAESSVEKFNPDAPVIKEGFPPIIPMTDDVPAEEEKPVRFSKPAPAQPLTGEEKQNLSDSLSEGIHEEPKKEYVFPPLDILKLPEKRDKYFDEQELYRNGDKLIEALSSFNVTASVSAIVPGPTVTRYELTPAPGVKISKFTGLADDLALCLAAPAGIRIEAPIPNKSAIGIEIPNRDKLTITFREVIDTPEFRNAKSKLTVGLGKNISGDAIFCNIAKMPHLLVAGTTGSGKSVLMNSMIVSILYKAKPEEVRLILIDPKQVEFGMYNGIPHLLVPVVTDPRKASGALAWAVTEMLDRYKTFNDNRVRDLEGYNKLRENKPELENKPQIVVFIDELADLMIAAPGEVEDSIQRIAQMGRAAGIHLVVATQRPSVDVITGVIKANMSSRIALTVKSQIDSRTIIDAAGAEKLTGHGDMLYSPVDFAKPLRVQGCYLSDAEINDIVKFLKEDNGEAVYSSDIEEQIIKCIPQGKKKGPDIASDGSVSGGIEGISDDDKFAEVMDFILSNPDQVSISSLQRHLRIGFARAGRLIDELLDKGYIQNVEGSKTKKVVITQNEWYELLAMSHGGSSSGEQQMSMFDKSAADDIFINPDTVTTVTDEDMGFSGDF